MAAAAAACAFLALMPAQPAAAEDVYTVNDAGFDFTQCAGTNCTNSTWEKSGTQAFFCLETVCGDGASRFEGWAILGADIVEEGQTVTGSIQQQMEGVPANVPATLLFDLKLDPGDAFGIQSTFSVDLTGGEGECCLYEKDAGNSYLFPGYNHIELDIPPNQGDTLEFSTTCRNLFADPGTRCAGWNLDEVELRYHVPGPTTKITKKPAKRSKTKKAKFEFETDDEDLIAFDCSLDGESWEPCVSPKSYRVGPGLHAFKVREGSDPNSPATSYEWTVKK